MKYAQTAAVHTWGSHLPSGYHYIPGYAYYESSSCGYFGNFVASMGQTGGGWTLGYPTGGEPRDIICITVLSYGLGNVCSTHLSADANSQNTQIGSIVSFRNTTGASIIGGDFNFIGSDPRHAFFANTNLAEASGTPPTNAVTWHSKSTSNQQRLDYIYFDDYYFNVDPTPIIVGPLTNTDHYVYEGFVK